MEFLFDGPEDGTIFAFAHGAGGPMDSSFMHRVAAGLAQDSIRVARFEFPYMRARRQSGRRGAPDREAVLLETWREVARALGGGARIFIGGKSMGGRMASMVADELGVKGLICFGYPFHPPGNPTKLRTAHLEQLVTPALIIQGTHDLFGTAQEVPGYRLSAAIRVEWLPGADHSFKPARGSNGSERQNVERAVWLASHFMIGGD